jgi:hypothetical protein
MTEHVKHMISECFLCLKGAPGGNAVTPLGFGCAFSPDRPLQKMTFDFLKVTDSLQGFGKMLVIRDTFSGYCWIYPTKGETVAELVPIMLQWISQYEPPDMWVCDQAPNFTSTLMSALRRAYDIDVHFVTAHSPQGNGFVERQVRTILETLRPLLAETTLDAMDWHYLIPPLMRHLNTTPSAARGNLSPYEILFAVRPKSPLSAVFLPQAGAAGVQQLTPALVQQAVADMRSTLDDIRPVVTAAEAATHERNRRYFAKRTTSREFKVGEFVSYLSPTHANKLLYKWWGPFEIVSADPPYHFTIRNAVTNTNLVVHWRQLRYFGPADIQLSDAVKNLIHRDRDDGYEIDTILSHRVVDNDMELEVRWKGFAEPTFVSLDTLYSDAPNTVLPYTQAHPRDRSLQAALRHAQQQHPQLQPRHRAANRRNNNDRRGDGAPRAVERAAANAPMVDRAANDDQHADAAAADPPARHGRGGRPSRPPVRYRN